MYIEFHLKHLEVHVIVAKQEKVWEQVCVVCTCTSTCAHVQVHVPVGLLKLSIN